MFTKEETEKLWNTFLKNVFVNAKFDPMEIATRHLIEKGNLVGSCKLHKKLFEEAVNEINKI